MELRTTARRNEPETLRIHRAMYEQRLKDMEISERPSAKKDEVIDIASNPAIVQHRDEPSKAAMDKG